MAALYHERARRHQAGQFGIVGYVAHVPFGHFIFACEHVAIAVIYAHVLANPFVEVTRTNAYCILFGQDSWYTHGRLAAVGKSVKANALWVNVGKRREPFERSL